MNNLLIAKFLRAGGVITKLPAGKAKGLFPTYSTRYSVANIGRKAATLRNFGLAKGRG